MIWYSIRDDESGQVTGIILEADRGGLVALALDDSGKNDSTYRAVHLIMKRPRLYLNERSGSSVVSRSFTKKDAGYGLALVLSVGYPLVAGLHGRMKRTGPPQDMVRRIWKALSQEPMPSTMRVADSTK